MWHPNHPDFLETQLLWRIRLQFCAACRSSSKRRLEDNRGCQIKTGWEMLSILLLVQSRRAKGTWNLERHRALTQVVSHPCIAGRLNTTCPNKRGCHRPLSACYDMTLGSALTSWQPNPNSLLTCMDYPSFPCDLEKNTEKDGHIVT